jgi:putative ABC transport system ATP-binding protein
VHTDPRYRAVVTRETDEEAASPRRDTRAPLGTEPAPGADADADAEGMSPSADGVREEIEENA